jgi:hypothetical protein
MTMITIFLDRQPQSGRPTSCEEVSSEWTLAEHRQPVLYLQLHHLM